MVGDGPALAAGLLLLRLLCDDGLQPRALLIERLRRVALARPFRHACKTLQLGGRKAKQRAAKLCQNFAALCFALLCNRKAKQSNDKAKQLSTQLTRYWRYLRCGQQACASSSSSACVVRPAAPSGVCACVRRLSPPAALACDRDAFEPNDDLAHATRITIPFDASLTLCPAGDVDVFRVTVTEPTNVTIEMECGDEPALVRVR